MIILPAIDIQNGECVRLTKGDFATAERVAEDPLQTAFSFKEAGAEWIHMVDLDGAKTAQAQNRDVFISVAEQTELKIELGGGIRDFKTAEYYLENGIERIIVGSLAVRNPKMVAELVRVYGDRIIVGIDAEKGQVKIDGWLNAGRVNFITLAREMEYIGVRHIIYTDITKDGTLSGPNLDDLTKLRENVNVNVIASGGITGIEDIQALAKLGLYGAICGKALYHGTLDIKKAITEAEKTVDVKKFQPHILEDIELKDDVPISETLQNNADPNNKKTPKNRYPKNQRSKNLRSKGQCSKASQSKPPRLNNQRQNPKDQHSNAQNPKGQHFNAQNPKDQHSNVQNPKEQHSNSRNPKGRYSNAQRSKGKHFNTQRNSTSLNGTSQTVNHRSDSGGKKCSPKE